jgi:O-methyltransferase involved in polyketide biosynthesis
MNNQNIELEERHIILSCCEVDIIPLGLLEYFQEEEIYNTLKNASSRFPSEKMTKNFIEYKKQLAIRQVKDWKIETGVTLNKKEEFRKFCDDNFKEKDWQMLINKSRLLSIENIENQNKNSYDLKKKLKMS